MAPDNSAPDPSSHRARRWTAARSSPASPYRFAFRLVGIPVLAIAGVLLYRGVHDRLVLPECDSARARQTLAEVFKQLQFEPVRDQPVKTVSSSKQEVVCTAVLPLPDGTDVVADYTFYWQGSKANMKYSISRRPPNSKPVAPPSPDKP